MPLWVTVCEWARTCDDPGRDGVGSARPSSSASASEAASTWMNTTHVHTAAYTCTCKWCLPSRVVQLVLSLCLRQDSSPIWRTRHFFTKSLTSSLRFSSLSCYCQLWIVGKAQWLQCQGEEIWCTWSTQLLQDHSIHCLNSENSGNITIPFKGIIFDSLSNFPFQ